MRPDINNTGQLESTQQIAGTKLEKTPQNAEVVQEQKSELGGELPSNTAGSTQAQPQAQTTTDLTNTPVKDTQTTSLQATSPKEQYEAALANIPAEDAEVIEKVWVEKADEIEEKTKDDPYTEDEAQHSLSRAYLKKRFNLDVD